MGVWHACTSVSNTLAAAATPPVHMPVLTSLTAGSQTVGNWDSGGLVQNLVSFEAGAHIALHLLAVPATARSGGTFGEG